MPVLVGDGTTGSEGKSDRLGIATGSSDPGSGAAGDLYFDTGSSKLKYFDGTSWNELGSGGTSTVGNIDPFGDSSGIALWQMDGNGDDVGGSHSGTPTNVVWSNTAKFGANSSDHGTNSGTIAISGTPKNSYPFTVSLWAQNNVDWDTVGSGAMNECFNANISNQRVSMGFVQNSGWVQGVTIMYGGTSHYAGHAEFMNQGGSTRWHHIVWSVAGSANTDHQVWINGHPVALKDEAGGHGGTAGWNIGSNSSGGEHWDGKIDQVRFFNREITDDEALALYREGATSTAPITTHCKLHYDFSDTACYSGSGTTVNNLATDVEPWIRGAYNTISVSVANGNQVTVTDNGHNVTQGSALKIALQLENPGMVLDNSSFNTAYTITSVTANTFTYSITGTNRDGYTGRCFYEDPGPNFEGEVDGATFGGSGNAKYFDFDGTNDHIDTIDWITNDIDAVKNLSNKQVTLEAWYWADAVGGGDGINSIISSQNDGANQNGVSISVDSRTAHGGGPNGYHFQMGRQIAGWSTGGTGNTNQGTGDVSTHWNHVVATFDGGRKRVYKNGMFIEDMGDFTLPSTDQIDYQQCVYNLGCQPDNNGDQRWYNGKIAIARIFDTALSHAQIQHNYNVERSRFAEPQDICWALPETGWTLSNDARTATYTGSGYSDCFTGKLGQDAVYDFKLEVTNGDTNGGWWFSGSQGTTGSHPDERPDDTLGLRGGETQIGASGAYAAANGWSPGQDVDSGYSSFSPDGNTNINFVINMKVRKVWMRAEGDALTTWKGGGNPANPASIPTFYLPPRQGSGNTPAYEDVYFCCTGYDNASQTYKFSNHGQSNL